MEQNLIIKRYGVNFSLSMTMVYLAPIDESADKNEYMYTVEIMDGFDRNGNGYKLMKIYTKDKYKEIQIGGWTISPIVKMHYNWGGYTDCIDVVDSRFNSYSIEVKTNPKGYDFYWDVELIFKKILSLRDMENVTHLRLEEIMNEVHRNGWSEYRIKEAKSLCCQLEDTYHMMALAAKYREEIVRAENTNH